MMGSDGDETAVLVLSNLELAVVSSTRNMVTRSTATWPTPGAPSLENGSVLAVLEFLF